MLQKINWSVTAFSEWNAKAKPGQKNKVNMICLNISLD